MPVYVIVWETESGDKGIHGYWDSPPSRRQQEQFMEDNHSDEFDAEGCCYIYWELIRLDKK